MADEVEELAQEFQETLDETATDTTELLEVHPEQESWATTEAAETEAVETEVAAEPKAEATGEEPEWRRKRRERLARLKMSNSDTKEEIKEKRVEQRKTCELCQVNVHDRQWDAHISGARHRRFLQKSNNPDKASESNATPEPSKNKNKRGRNRAAGAKDKTEGKDKADAKPEVKRGGRLQPNPKMLELIEACHDPLVGLVQITEIHSSETDKIPTYYCSLCDHNLGQRVLIPHMLGGKHRMKYLTQFYPEYRADIMKIPLKEKVQRSALMEEYVGIVEIARGRPKMKLQTEANFKPVPLQPNEDKDNRGAAQDNGQGQGKRGRRGDDQFGGPQAKRGRQNQGNMMQGGRGRNFNQGWGQGQGYPSQFNQGMQRRQQQDPTLTLLESMRKTVHLLDRSPICTEDEGAIGLQLSNQLNDALLKFKSRLESHIISDRLMNLSGGIVANSRGGGQNNADFSGGTGSGYNGGGNLNSGYDNQNYNNSFSNNTQAGYYGSDDAY